MLSDQKNWTILADLFVNKTGTGKTVEFIFEKSHIIPIVLSHELQKKQRNLITITDPTYEYLCILFFNPHPDIVFELNVSTAIFVLNWSQRTGNKMCPEIF
jgi:hypothetical protein